MSVNRVYVLVTNSPGLSGDIVVGAAVSGPYAGMTNDDTGKSFDLSITLGASFEVRSGCVYTHSTSTFTRGSLERTSGAFGLPVNFGAGARVAVVAAASSLPTRAETLGLRSLLGGGMGSGGAITIVSDTRQYTRNSGNAGADNNIGTPLTSFVLPAGMLGPRGRLRIEYRMAQTASANVKNLGFFVESAPFGLESPMNSATAINTHGGTEILNTSLTTQKWSGSTLWFGASAAGFATGSHNTAVDLTINVHGRWSVGSVNGEFIRLEGLLVEAFYGA